MSKITNLLGDQAAFYLEHTCRTVSYTHLPVRQRTLWSYAF